jgi:hypothetical protein
LLGLLILAIIGGANWLSLSVKSDLASLASDRANRVKAVTHAQIDNSSASYLNSPHTHTTNAFSDTSKSGKLEQISLPAKRSTALFSHITKDSNGKQVKQFDFPKDIYLGRISIGDSAECWEAKGRKQFPVSAKLVLVASPQLMAQVDSFERFRADDLYGIRLFSQAMPALKPATPRF